MTRKADPNGLKKCYRCGEYKVRSEAFYYNKRKGSWDSPCKECRVEMWQEYRNEKRAAQPKAKYRLAPEGTKYCAGCDQYCSLDQFYHFKSRISSYCRTCVKAKNKVARERDGAHTGWKNGLWRGKPMLTQEQKDEKRHHWAYRKNLRGRGYVPVHTMEEWRELLDRTGHKCIKCGVPEEYTSMTRDHIAPLCFGGTDAIDNIQPLCNRCNGKKHVGNGDYREQQ